MIRGVTTQTGLQRGVIVRRGPPATRIRSSGGNVSLKYFGAKETPSGVSAAPRGHRQDFPGAFYGIDRLEKVKSGVFIPAEMVSGASAETLQTVVDHDLPDRLIHELLRAIGGAG